MNKKAIKKILAFLKMLKAPAKMLPYVFGLVIAALRRITEEDDAVLVDLAEQGFVCRKSEQIAGGCGSPAVAKSGGSIAVAFACERVKNGALISSLCLQISRDPLLISGAGKRFLFDTPLQLGNITLSETAQGLMVGYRTRSNSYLHIPSGFEKAELKAYLNENKALAVSKKNEGSYYALISADGAEITNAAAAPADFTAPAITLSGGETLWLGTKRGKAEAYIAKDVCKGFNLVGTVPTIEPGRTVSQVCCAKLKTGRILAVVCSAGELYSSFSDDMGARWSIPKALHINGISPNLAVSEDGVLALSFVDPSKSQAIRCCINKDGESDWCKVRLLVSSTASNMRKPCTVSNGNQFFTVSRQRFCGEKESSIVFTQWKPLKDDYDPAAQAEIKKQEKKNARKLRKKKA